MKKNRLIILLAAITLVFTASCGDDPTTPAKDDDSIDWPGMTSRDDVIKTVVLTYMNPRDGESESKYNALLHSQYYFMLHVNDIGFDESPIMSRSEDILSTEWIFAEQTMLELLITPEEEKDSWYPYPDIGGTACDICWVTERQYFIRVQFGDGTNIYQSPIGRAFVGIIVAPDESDASKWVLRAMFDLGI